VGITFSHKNLREKEIVSKEGYEIGSLEDRDLRHSEPEDLSF
jgi:hypothetical protein